MTYRKPPATDKILVDTCPEQLVVYRSCDWLPDGVDPDLASDTELRKAYEAFLNAGRVWRQTYETPSIAELIADPVGTADVPWDRWRIHHENAPEP